jgi:dolichol-phosphate mannosyltransferase
MSCKSGSHLAGLLSVPEVSVLSPVYLGERCVPELVERLRESLARITQNYEIVLVEDGSPDRSWHSIQEACRSDGRVKGIRLSRNFGQTCALTAGLTAVRGRYVVVLDCDLQDDPEYIPDLLSAAQRGCDIVYTLKRQRRHVGLKNLFGKLFHGVFNMPVADKKFRSNKVIGNYSVLSRRAVDAFLAFGEYHRNYLCILRRLGFDAAYVEIDHRERPYGTSSYSMSRLLRVAIDAITSETDRLLYLSIGVGLAFVAISFLAAAYVVIAYFVHGFREGWASVFVLILVSTGAILTSLGVTGVYVGKIFEQTKNRPLFLVRERLNFVEDAPPPARRLSHKRDEYTIVECV